jgi:hypothetical protein
MRTKHRALLKLCAAALLALLATPATSQKGPRRIIEDIEGSVLRRAWQRANVVSAESVAVRLERSSLRVLSRDLAGAGARPRVAGGLARAEAELPLRGARAGKISVSSGSLTRRKPISLEKQAAVESVAVRPRASGRTASALQDAEARELSNAQQLRRQDGQQLSPEARKVTGQAIRDAEQGAAAAATRAQKARSLEQQRLAQQFYKRQQELSRLTAKKAFTGAAGGGARGQLVRQRITDIEERMTYINNRHVEGGKATANKSIFNKGENVRQLVRQAETVPPVMQEHGNTYRITNAGRNVGIDRVTKRQTPFYTVITTKENKLINSFPGLPTGRGVPNN